MRKVKSPNLPNTNLITDKATLDYAKSMNLELDNLNRDLNRYVGKLVVTSVTDTYSIIADDEVILCSGTFTVTLPGAGSSEGKVFYIKNTGSGTVTISSDETIDDDDTYDLGSQYDFISVVSDGTEWWVITRYIQ